MNKQQTRITLPMQETVHNISENKLRGKYYKRNIRSESRTGAVTTCPYLSMCTNETLKRYIRELGI